MISTIRALLKFVGHSDCAVSNLRIQKLSFNSIVCKSGFSVWYN